MKAVTHPKKQQPMKNHPATVTHDVDSMIRAAHPCIAIVGMNGIGKSHFGKSLASKLQLKRIDTDSEFRKQHGDEHAFIAERGWEHFRAVESYIVRQSLLPGHVVVLGGGAIESDDVREALKEKAIVVWMQAGHKRTHKNLTVAKKERPELKHGVTPENVKNLIAQRTPHYESVADVVLLPHIRYKDHVPVVIGLLQRFLASHTVRKV